MSKPILRHLLAALVLMTAASAISIPDASADRPITSTTRGWVGIVLGDADSSPGVTINTVLRRSPAHTSGVHDGDRVLSVNGREVRTPGKLQSILREHRIGRTIVLSIVRDDEAHDIEITLTPSPPSSQVLQMHHLGFDAPEMALTTLDGDPLDLANRDERPIIVEFWATWCSVCRQVSRKLEQAANQSPDLFEVVSVTSEDPSTVREHLETHPKAHEIAIDEGNLAHDDFLVTSYPFVAVIGTDGKLEAIVTDPGKINDLINDLEDNYGVDEDRTVESDEK